MAAGPGQVLFFIDSFEPLPLPKDRARESLPAFKRCPAPIFGLPRVPQRGSERKYEGKDRENEKKGISRSREIATPCVRQRFSMPSIPATPLGKSEKKKEIERVMHRFLDTEQDRTMDDELARKWIDTLWKF